MTERDVVLIDMDCFYVQVEQRLDPSLKGKPCAVVQYKTWKGGGIIAVGYEARKFGVTRNMRGDDAKQKCPEIHLARVPETRGKADLTRYREAGAEVIAVFSKFCSCVERASVDEAFLDITQEVSQRLKALDDSCTLLQQIPNTFVEGYDRGPEGTGKWLEHVTSDAGAECERRLAVAAAMVEEMRAAVFQETGFTCSAGISHNKMLAKLACGRNKPNKQTVFPLSSVPSVFETLPIPKIRHLGGKLGAFLIDDLHLQYMGDLVKFTEQELQAQCGAKTGSWLFNACRGIESECVNTRELPKSIGCSKNFRGKEILDTKEKVKFWLSELSKEVSERLDKDLLQNKRTAKSLTLHVRMQHQPGSSSSSSRACLLARYDADKICSDAYAVVKQFNTASVQSAQWSPPLTNLGLSASKFSEQGESQKILSMFTAQSTSLLQMKSTQFVACSSTSALSQLPPEINDETSQEICDPLSKPGEINVTKVQTSRAGSKSLKPKQSEKGSFVSIKSFFSQSETREEKGSSALPLVKENAEVLLHVDNDVEIKKTPLSKPEKSISGFFANKMKSASSTEVCSSSEARKSFEKRICHDGSSKQMNELLDESALSAPAVPHSHSESQDATDKTVLVTPKGIRDYSTPEKNLKDNTGIEMEHEENNSKNKQEEEFLVGRSVEMMPTTVTGGDGTQSPSRVRVLECCEDFMECESCGDMVPVWEMPEHTDYHFALALQKEVNKVQTVTPGSGSSASGSISQGKRKNISGTGKGGRGSKKSKGVTRDKSIQPLTAFFSKS
ncbi:DNA polymerase eta [Elysia marginata]|uniref:DNA polymerase eta n=1 Tax=Elysia marginata TaxID=1093978 RepID=A0AAV4ITR2_9GAST|nr:DNA polymerase eta [Elysia marginata]